MITSIWLRAGIPFLLCSTAVLVFATSRDVEALDNQRVPASSAREGAALAKKIVGKASAGREVFGFETFGNEGFWNAPGTFDDKMVVVDASPGGGKRGNAVPMLLDLDRKTMFLHDASVKGLDALLDPSRGKTAPHPFYVATTEQRDDVVQFLRGLDTGPVPR